MTVQMGRLLLSLALCLAGFTYSAHACSAPVFRYALERWPASHYQLLVAHQGSLEGRSQQQVEQLRSLIASANVQLRLVDLHGAPSTEDRKRVERWTKRGSFPQALLFGPEDTIDVPPLWAGFQSTEELKALLQSPARRLLVDHLSRGASVVWLLLESSDAQADDAAAQLLAKELPRLEREIRLPTIEDPRDLLSTLPLKLSFPVLRISREDATEAGLVRLLLQGDQAPTGPVVFPVFGRGRVLISITGKELRPAVLERWASYLCGPCSCQVKELNPGFDLPLQADWDALLALSSPASAPVLEAPAIPPGKKVASVQAPERAFSVIPVLMIAGGLVVLTAAMIAWDRWRGARAQT
ncbi:MAG: hypothetical protein U0840_04820 [Gemmataceae bacterium]